MPGKMEDMGLWKMSAGLMVIGVLLLIAGSFWKVTDLDSRGANSMMWTGGGLLTIGCIATAIILY